MAPEIERKSGSTRNLNKKKTGQTAPLRQTNRLDMNLPAAIRFIFTERSDVLDVPVRNYMVVGRKHSGEDHQVDVDLAMVGGTEAGVSRYHAIIQINNGKISIKDFNSSNGTYLNGFVLKPMFGYRLRHGDELVMGNLKMSVQFLKREP